MTDRSATRAPARARARLAAVTAALLLGALAPLPAPAAVPHEVAIAKGIALINDGRWREALAPLDEAVAAAPESAEALFYAGVARSRLGEHAAARDLLQRALRVDESAEAYFELGRIAALTGGCEEADRLFERSASLAGGGRTGAEAAAARELGKGCRAAGEERSWRLSLSLGRQHDSNVVLDPDRPVAPRPEKGDDRWLAFFTAGAGPLRAGGFELGGAYSFYASRHDDLDDYDALYHRLAPTAAYAGWKAARPSLGYTLEHTSFGGDRYSLLQTVAAKVAVPEGSRATTEVEVQWRVNEFWDSELFTDNEGRSGQGWAAGLRQGVRLGPVLATLSGFREEDDADEDSWSSAAWRAGARAGWQVAAPLLLEASAEYVAKDYDAPAAGAAAAREDRSLQYGAILTWSFLRRASAALTWSRTENDSNVEAYEYRRTIWGLVLSVGM